jgi:hypothetical protein
MNCANHGEEFPLMFYTHMLAPIFLFEPLLWVKLTRQVGIWVDWG